MDTPEQDYCGRKHFFHLPLIIIALFALSAIVMHLWNWILPSISTLTALTYWQAMGLLVLCRILFAGFHFGHVHGQKAPFTHPDFKGKFMHMNPEEKQKFKDQFKMHCCKTPNPPAEGEV